MNTVKVHLAHRSYPVYIGAPLEKIGDAIRPHKPSKVLVVTNAVIFRLHKDRLLKGLRTSQSPLVFAMVPDGEQYKTLEQSAALYRSCLKAGLDRNSMIIGFGGGVIGDLAGFTGATYMRGVQVVHVPTTLLAMVDSSVGGKTGVDLPEGKNLVGSFYQPQMVWIDETLLKTLSLIQWSNGMAEIIKYGVIADRKFFEFLESTVDAHHHTSSFQKLIIQKVRKYPFNLSASALERIITRSCEIKARVVEKDEKEEKGIREMLNFGHTFGHALESSTKYSVYQHGEAVAVGMVMAARLAEALMMFRERERVERIIEQANLPKRPKQKINADKLMSYMKKDKKVKHGRSRFVLPTRIGQVTICGAVKEKILRSVLKEFE